MSTNARTLTPSFNELSTLGKNITVLYVEDNEMIREEFTLFLKRFFPNVDRQRW
jgi:hypothetical protein